MVYETMAAKLRIPQNFLGAQQCADQGCTLFLLGDAGRRNCVASSKFKWILATDGSFARRPRLLGRAA